MSQSTDNLSPQQKRELLAKILKEKAKSKGIEFPLSYSQRIWWLLYQLAPDSSAFNIAYVGCVEHELDIKALRKSLDKLVSRHTILQTVYDDSQNKLTQKVNPNQSLDFQVMETSDWTQDKIDGWISENADRPFNLQQGPILRANVLTSAQDNLIKNPILLLTTHHIAVDFRGFEIIIEELELLYQAYKTGIEPNLPPLKKQYKNYVEWEAKKFISPQTEEHWNYWQQKLAGDLPVLNLPTDKLRPPIQSYVGKTFDFILDRQTSEGLRELSKQATITLYTTVLAGFGVLLSRYSGQEDIIIGSPLTTRDLTEFESLVGCFINPIPLRMDLSGNPTFREVLQKTYEVVLEALEHQDFPFAVMLERLELVRDRSRSPLFQVTFAWDKFSQALDKTNQSRLIVEYLNSEMRGPDCDIKLVIFDTGTSLKGKWTYNTDLFEEKTIQNLTNHFKTLLTAIVNNPDTPIQTLLLLTKAEKQQILIEWNNTKKDYPTEQCLQQLFEQKVQKTPNAIAVVYEHQQLTYRQLNECSNQLAHYLRELGIKPDVLVGICVERSVEMVIGLLGILKAGGAYVPIDPDYPSERIAFMLEDANVPILLTQNRLVSQLPIKDTQVICLDEEKFDNYPQSRPLTEVQSNNLAYVIYTSGSTGKPKGAMNCHQGIVNRLLWMQETYQLDDRDRILQKTPFSFDVSVWEFFWPLITGARLIIAEPEGHRDSAYLVKLIHEQEITTLHFVPSMLQIFIQEPDISRCSSLKRVICSGEALPYDLQQRFFDKLDCELHNLYGPTEAAIDVTYWQCEPNHPLKKVPIGRPVANTQIYILDPYLKPVPIGVAGELHIGGIQVGKGYLNRSELTQEKFIVDPFEDKPQSKLYKTGDLARFLSDGTIEYLGRIDHQVKIRGFRIELGEIEAALTEHEQVKEAIVLAKEDKLKNQSLVAYVVPICPQIGEKIKNQLYSQLVPQLRSFLGQNLPEYMVPNVIMLLESFPLTPNGKVNRRALPIPDNSLLVESKNLVEPVTPTEEILLTIWREILNLELGVTDNFFDLGGHSLLGVQMIARIRDIFGADLPLRKLFEKSTVRELSKYIDNIRETSEVGEKRQIVKCDRSKNLPLSLDQERLWFLEQLTQGILSHNLPYALELKGELNPEIMEQCFREILQRHETLRTSFQVWEGLPVQVIAPELNFVLPVIELQDLSELEKETEIKRLSNQEAQKSFDLSKPPLMRAKLLKVRKKHHILLLTLHHIIADNLSFGIFINELSEIYQTLSNNQQFNLPELLIQYADFAQWQRQELQGDFIGSQLKYWQENLKNVPPVLSLPTDFPRPQISTFQAKAKPFELNKQLMLKLRDFSQQKRVTLFMTLLAAFALLLQRYSEEDDIVIGSPIANRNQREVESLIGFFAYPLPLRIRLSNDASFGELVEEVRHSTLDAYNHQNTPLSKIVEVTGVQSNLQHNPLFQVLFTFLANHLGSIQLDDLVIEPKLITDQISTEMDLGLTIYEQNNIFQAVLVYQESLFEDDTIEALINSYCHILEQVISQPKTPLKEFSVTDKLISKIELAKLRERSHTITITATFTAEPIADSLEFWMKELQLLSQLTFAPYNQVFQQILATNSIITQNNEGVNVILVRLEDWLRFEKEQDISSNFESSIEKNTQDLITGIKKLSTRLSVPLILCLCPSSQRILNDVSKAEFIENMEYLIEKELEDVGGVYIITSSVLMKTYPVDNYDDPQGDNLGHIPYTPTLYNALGTMIARKIYSINSKPYKAIILDCDQTLWKGVCGEDGASGVEIDVPRYAFQEFIVKQQNAGKLICLCSKNQEEDVWAVFDYHKSMPLKRKHLVSYKINWQSKSENIKALAKELNIGLDSFIFIDDNPVECAEVQGNCPEILTIQLPEKAEEIPQFIEHIWAFDQLQTTQEDRQRTQLYRQNVQREQYQQKSLTFADFLKGLQLEVNIEPLGDDSLSRVAQLTQRTNQFNLTTIRRSETDIKQLCQAGNLECLVVNVIDRFGDYGLVGVLLYATNTTYLEVDTFLLSCRVLGRGVEHQMLKCLGQIAQNKRIKQVKVPYICSEKNQPALKFLQSIKPTNVETTTEGFIFEFTINQLAELAFKPSEEKVISKSSQKTKTSSSISLQAPSDLVNRIAEEFREPVRISETIQAQQTKQRSDIDENFAVPRNEIEQELTLIWTQILKIDKVGIYDNFFDLGGNSLLATQVVSRIYEVMGIDLPLRSLFERPTIITLAEQIDKTRLTLAKLQQVSTALDESSDDIEEFEL